jgi:hypothetical protein
LKLVEYIEACVAEQYCVAKPRIGNIKENRNMILKAWKNCSNKRKQKVCKKDL